MPAADGDVAGIEVRDLHVTFPLYHGGTRTLRRTLAGMAHGRFEQDR